MRALLLLVTTLVSAVCWSDAAQRLEAGPYQGPDGAITMTKDGIEVEPYFATKALLVAQDAGLDTHEVAVKWIGWMLPRQRKDGRIDRWCRNKSSAWRDCGAADADDSMLALWAELLYRNAPPTGLPLEWKQSADKSLAYLKTLRNRWGVYYVSHRNHTPLFMDNVEIYSSFKDIGQQISRWDLEGAASMHAQSEELAQAIRNLFWDESEVRFRPSTQKTRPGFYPDAVGQTYPWLEGLPSPRDPEESWKEWKRQYARGWLQQSYDPHPWGLVALTALKLNDVRTAECWMQKAEAQRSQPGWNILEEATFQSVKAKTPSVSSGSCTELESGQ